MGCDKKRRNQFESRVLQTYKATAAAAEAMERELNVARKALSSLNVRNQQKVRHVDEKNHEVQFLLFHADQ